MEEAEVELQDYLNILRKRGWIIILTACITAVSALGFSLVQTPKYKATAKLSVNPARADWGLANAAKTLLRNYTINMTTHKTAQKVIDRAQLDMSTDDLLSKVTVSSDESNLTLQVDAKDYDPVVAIQIAQTMAEVFIEGQTEWNNKQDKSDRIEVSLLDDVRDAPLFSPKKKINTLAGGIFGVLLGGVIILLLEWLESDILRTPGDVERHTRGLQSWYIQAKGPQIRPGATDQYADSFHRWLPGRRRGRRPGPHPVTSLVRNSLTRLHCSRRICNPAAKSL
jgi:capsular polysaccharide biosynthesis protein